MEASMVNKGIASFNSADLNGYLMACTDGMPVLIAIDGLPGRWIPLFRSQEELDSQMKMFPGDHYDIKVIVDGLDFLKGVEQSGGPIQVCTDLRIEGSKIEGYKVTFKCITLGPCDATRMS
jgi:hypothetical protein